MKPDKGALISVNARRYRNRMRGYEAARAEVVALKAQLEQERWDHGVTRTNESTLRLIVDDMKAAAARREGLLAQERGALRAYMRDKVHRERLDVLHEAKRQAGACLWARSASRAIARMIGHEEEYRARHRAEDVRSDGT